MHRYVHKTGRCGSDREVLASFYGTGRLTATGERFNPHGVTAASYDYVLGTTITVTNPHNGRTCQVRVNDHGPNGIARVMGARIDFALGARDCLGMVASQYVCAPDAHSFAQMHEKETRRVVYIKTPVHVRDARHVVFTKTRHHVVASQRSAVDGQREALCAKSGEEAGADLFRHPHQMVKES